MLYLTANTMYTQNIKLREAAVMQYKTKPKMIMFDVGGTLFKGGNFSARNGLEALRLAAVNPQDSSADELEKLWDEYLLKIGSGHKSPFGVALDFPISAALRYITMNAGLCFEIPTAEQEEIFDRHNSQRSVIDGVPQLLDTIHSLGIRAAVISNNALSGNGLRLAIKHWIPNEKMEFFLTSADLLLTKPCKEIFIAATSFAHLEPSECWYCGDGRIPDVDGAFNADMLPILLDTQSSTPSEIRTDGGREYLTVNSWHVLTNHLKENF